MLSSHKGIKYYHTIVIMFCMIVCIVDEYLRIAESSYNYTIEQVKFVLYTVYCMYIHTNMLPSICEGKLRVVLGNMQQNTSLHDPCYTAYHLSMHPYLYLCILYTCMYMCMCLFMCNLCVHMRACYICYTV